MDSIGCYIEAHFVAWTKIQVSVDPGDEIYAVALEMHETVGAEVLDQLDLAANPRLLGICGLKILGANTQSQRLPP